MILVGGALHAQSLRQISPSKIHQMPGISVEQYTKAADKDGEDSPILKNIDTTIYDDLYSDRCSWYCGGTVDNITASSCHKPMGKFNYLAANAHDFNHESVWATDGNGIGESLTYTFAGSCPRVTTVKIINGHVKTEKAWNSNCRVKRMKMYYNGKPYAILNLKDSRTLQCFEVGTLGFNDANAQPWTLKFEIMEVYPPKNNPDADTVIAELYFDGIDVH